MHIYLSICLSICLSTVGLSVHLFIYLSVCLSIFLPSCPVCPVLYILSCLRPPCRSILSFLLYLLSSYRGAPLGAQGTTMPHFDGASRPSHHPASIAPSTDPCQNVLVHITGASWPCTRVLVLSLVVS